MNIYTYVYIFVFLSVYMHVHMYIYLCDNFLCLRMQSNSKKVHEPVQLRILKIRKNNFSEGTN